MKLGLMVELVSLLATTLYSGLALSRVVVHGAEDFCCIENGSYVKNYSLCTAFRHRLYPNISLIQGDDNVTYMIEDGHLAISIFWLIIPQALNGVALMLVFLTVLEFVFAQAPRAMQGILTGLWYAMQAVNVLAVLCSKEPFYVRLDFPFRQGSSKLQIPQVG